MGAGRDSSPNAKHIKAYYEGKGKQNTNYNELHKEGLNSKAAKVLKMKNVYTNRRLMQERRDFG